MINNVESFYSLLMESPEEVSKIQEELRKVETEKELMSLIDSKIIPLARERGFKLTKEDLLSYEREALSKLSEEDLLKVSGGVSFSSKKVISLLLAGVSFSGNLQQATYAVNTITASNQDQDNQGTDQNQDQENEEAKRHIIKSEEYANKTIEKVEIPEGTEELYIEGSAFQNSTIEEEFEIPTSVTKLTISNRAFAESHLKALKIPDSIKELNIGESAFWRAEIKEFEIPASVEKLTIGAGAFGESKFDTFKMIGNVNELNIGEGAFEKASITELKIIAKEKKLTIVRGRFAEASLETFQIEGNVEELNIEGYAFREANIGKFEIPESVKELNIGEEAFSEANIGKFKIPESVKELNIGKGAFDEATVREFKIPESIDHDAFRKAIENGEPFRKGTNQEGQTAEQNNQRPDQSQEEQTANQSNQGERQAQEDQTTDQPIDKGFIIDNNFFKNYRECRFVKNENGQIGTMELNDRNELEFENLRINGDGERREYEGEIIIAEDDDTIGIIRLNNRGELEFKKLVIEQGGKIGINELNNNNRTEFIELDINSPRGEKIITPDGRIGKVQIMGNGLKFVEEGRSNNGKMTITKEAFVDEERAINLQIPSWVKDLTIEEGAFAYAGIKQLKMPDEMRTLTIERSAFLESEIVSFKMPSELKNLNIGSNAFLESNIKEFKVSREVLNFDIGDGAFQGSFLERFIMPAVAASGNIRTNAFRDCPFLQSVNIPSGVIEIGDGAFENCKNLSETKINACIRRIGINAFKGCTSLKVIESRYPADSDLTIEEGAFAESGIERFYADNETQNDEYKRNVVIKKDAFKDCVSLKSIEILGKEITLEEGCLNDKCISLQYIALPSAEAVDVQEDLTKFKEDFALLIPIYDGTKERPQGINITNINFNQGWFIRAMTNCNFAGLGRRSLNACMLRKEHVEDWF